MTAICVKSVRTASIAIFQFRIRGCIRFVAVAFRSEEEVRWRKGPSLTYLMNLLSCMHPESMKPVWFHVKTMQLISCCIFRAAVSSYLSSLHTLGNSIFKCTSYAQTINITPTWIHLWEDLAKKPKRMCRVMITSSLPSLVNIHQWIL